MFCDEQIQKKNDECQSDLKDRLELKAYKAAEKAMTDTFGKRPIPTRSGGSIPIVAGFEKILGLKSILMGFGLASDDIHAPNENYPLQQFFKGIETIPLFYKYFAELSVD